MFSTFSIFGKHNKLQPKHVPKSTILGTSDSYFNNLVIDSIGRVYVSAWFMTSISNSSDLTISANGIAMYDPITSNWSAIGNGINSYIFRMAVDSNDNLYITGDFSEIGVTAETTITVNYIAKWNPNTSTWSALGSEPNVGLNGGGKALAIDSQDNVYVFGNFSTVAGTSINANNIAKWTAITNSWSALGNGIVSINLTPYDMCIDSNNNLYLAGYIEVYSNIAKWDSSESSWYTVGTGLNGQSNAITIDSNDNIYISGSFDSTGDGFFIGNMAKWDTLTSTWTSVISNVSVNPGCLKVDLDNNIYFGTTDYGQIFKYDGVSLSEIPWWSNLSVNIQSQIRDLAIDSNKNIYFTGMFQINNKYSVVKYE